MRRKRADRLERGDIDKWDCAMPRTDRSMRAMDGYSHRCDTGAYLDMRCILHTHTHTRRCASATKRAVDIQVEAHDPSLIGY